MATSITEPESTAKREIRQIIPATGFVAVFFDEDDGEPFGETMVGWALVVESVEGSDRTAIVGLVTENQSVVFADELPNLVGYMSPEGALDDWKDAVQEAYANYKNMRHQSDTDLPRNLQRKRSWFDRD